MQYLMRMTSNWCVQRWTSWRKLPWPILHEVMTITVSVAVHFYLWGLETVCAPTCLLFLVAVPL
jgi:hypothetical protein